MRRLLLALNDVVADAEISVLVVDNDRKLEGSAVCEELESQIVWPLTWVHEPEPGISFARNHAVRAGLAQNPDFIAFLDDDEYPEKQWLQELLRVQKACDADAVGGPVLSKFETEIPQWLEDGKYMERHRPPDASKVELRGGGGNCLLRAESLTPFLPQPFSPAYALTGGEDFEFFQRFSRSGCKIYWANEAIAHEIILPERLSKSWLRKRRYWQGQVYYRIWRQSDPSLFHDGERIARAASQIVVGCGKYVAFAFSETGRLDAELMMASALGKMSAYIAPPKEAYTSTYRDTVSN